MIYTSKISQRLIAQGTKTENALENLFSVSSEIPSASIAAKAPSLAA